MTTPSIRIADFDTWRPGYGFAQVLVLIAGTTQKASIFADEACTQAAANPQTLLQLTVGSISYGKFVTPFYTNQPYELQINTVDRTGVIAPPLTTLVGQDASEATVIPTGAVEASNLDDLFARSINVLDYGDFIAIGEQNASAITNTTTLSAAIGAAAAGNIGTVAIPGGTFQITAITLPANVVLVGQGREVTTLQSTEAVTPVVTVSGSLAGLRHLSIDGLSQVTDSVGLYAEMIVGVVLDDVLVQRFDIGIQLYGGSGNAWRDLYLSDCEIGYQGHGYSDSGHGGPLEFCRWDGGGVDTCTTAGIEIEDLDELCDHHSFSGIAFTSNTGIAFHAIGARATVLRSCSWNGNTTDVQLEDGNPINANADNTVIGFDCQDGSFVGTGANGAAINLSNTLQNVAFRRCEFTNETITLTSPGNNILAQDCRQISNVNFAGATTAWISSQTYNEGMTAGLTTSITAITAWTMPLVAGQRVYLETKVLARCRNNADQAYFHFVTSAFANGASLTYDNSTASFTAGDVLTGQTSKATARITVVTPSGTSGTLTLQDIDGEFQNGEAITDSGGGAATSTAAVSKDSCTASIGTNTVLFGPVRSDANWGATFSATGQDVSLMVNGDTSMNVEWFVYVEVVSTEQIQ
jgi:hypothetical protein